MNFQEYIHKGFGLTFLFALAPSGYLWCQCRPCFACSGLFRYSGLFWCKGFCRCQCWLPDRFRGWRGGGRCWPTNRCWILYLVLLAVIVAGGICSVPSSSGGWWWGWWWGWGWWCWWWCWCWCWCWWWYPIALFGGLLPSFTRYLHHPTPNTCPHWLQLPLTLSLPLDTPETCRWMIYPSPHNWYPRPFGLDRFVILAPFPSPFAFGWLLQRQLSLVAIDIHLIQWLPSGGPSFSFWLSWGLLTIWGRDQYCQGQWCWQSYQGCWYRLCGCQWCWQSPRLCWHRLWGSWLCRCWLYCTLLTVVLLHGVQSQPLRFQEISRCFVFKLLFQTAVYKFEGQSLKLGQEQASPLSQEIFFLSFCYLK